MVSPDDIREALTHVIDPELHTDIVDLGMVGDITVDGGSVVVGIALTIASCPMRGQIEADVERRVVALRGVDSVTIRMSVMSQEQRSTLMERARMRARETATPTAVSPSTRVIAVSSGKGGVGKSSLSVNLALAISEQGHSVGLLDADIWGFSAPRMLGANEMRLGANEDRKIVPTEARGIHLVSTGLLIDDEETALMWRGLMLSKAVEQFLNDVAWPTDLGYLVIDMPPGTGDVQMALARLLPQAEMVVVTTPQIAAQKVAARVADMARRSHMPIIGVIENMAGFTTEDGSRYDIFGAGGGASLADDLGVELLGSIPIDPDVASGGDSGDPVVIVKPEGPAAIAITSAADRIVEILPPLQLDSCIGRLATL
ncbi:MAG: Mrp/NBP35 family ATP-binding protein [Actinomycetota bacterium]|nr:Mrp/NBP35 family ATP-binding protein [Actinomycetota bacterium]MDK1017109.1 Mrp/NBP35 family ATP-binding protein [Actinomycetota bacterium]MDK1026654.1 Mrp/NBP35 family ATP-binding protein [Actinomycetota bacterium]MDK1037489.1 Mrp/NBP35 family ATP-binding protein [Actinomycetota bacterium]MDK1102076.1 Mrp/NBP35 family ATP-binding protein [Actinomycetota bacterium]